MRTITLDEVKKLSAKHGMTVEKAVQVLSKDGWNVTGRNVEDPLAMASKKGLKDNGVKAVQFYDDKKNENYHAIEMTFNGVTVRMTERKWDAIFGAITAGVLSVGAIKRQAAKIPAPVAKAAKQMKQAKSGVVYL